VTRNLLVPIETAMDHVVDERAEVAAERDAFATFAERVEACPTRSPSSVGPGSMPPAIAIRSDDAPDHAACLRRAYRETVMAVDHYDEPLVVNAAAELGPDIATALDGGVPIPSAFKRTLHDAVTDARTEREQFDAILQREHESLANARADLDDVVTALSRHGTSSPDAPHPTDGGSPPTPVTELVHRCERVCEDRQAVIQRQLTLRRVDGTLYDYLYEEQSWTYPVLSVVATLVDELSALRGRSLGTDE
jgi:hypothetical protein